MPVIHRFPETSEHMFGVLAFPHISLLHRHHQSKRHTRGMVAILNTGIESSGNPVAGGDHGSS